MIKILFADDNQLSLQYFENLIEYRQLGFEVVATAVDGEEAYRDFIKYQPDVIISDIQMPCMDGIELARKVNATRPDTIFVFLSSYQEFEFARAALNLQVNDYILKHETTKETLTEKLCSIKKIINKQRELKRNEMERTLYELLEGHHHGNDITRILEHGADFSGKYHLLLGEQCHLLPFVAQELGYQETEPSEFKIREIVYGLSGTFKCILKVAPFRYLFLINANPADGFNQAYGLKRVLKDNLASEFSILVLSENKPFKDCLQGYLECEASLDTMKFFNHSSIIYKDSIEPCHQTSQLDLTKLEESIIQRRYSDLIEQVDRNYSQVMHDKDYHGFEKLSKLVLQYLLKYHNKYLGGDLGDVFCVYDDFCQVLWFDVADFINWIRKKLETLILLLQDTQSNNYSSEVENALYFINQNYDDSSVSAEMIAEYAKLNINSLNRIFKKETGDTVWKKLTKVRVTKARQLLDNQEAKVSDVYAKVGFNSLSYFSTVFKKSYGYSPQEYKKNR